ncbi:hypothetical protein BKA56DRAFT_664955 [Ilyonectria sp. MPI-CAGE-AT-0026]|nr:hypothetical protein BKA56DRAFT_664955 [Ilyonectria sp. MPI-CAGE-AT-0026]
MTQPLQPQQQQQPPQQQQHVPQYQQSQYQQPQYQPIQPQQYQGKPPPPHVSSRGMWSTKLTLRIISIIFCIVIIGVAASVAVDWSLFPLVTLVPPAGVAFIWNFSESICLCVRRGHRGIHPGAVVGVDLILWLGYLVAIVIFAIWTGIADGYYYTYYTAFTNYRAIFGIGIIEILLHMILFIMGCYETSVRNRNQAPQIVYVQAPTGAAMYPANFPMAQAYQPVYAQGHPPVHQYQYTPVGQPKMTELPTTTPTPISPVYNQQAEH